MTFKGTMAFYDIQPSLKDVSTSKTEETPQTCFQYYAKTRSIERNLARSLFKLLFKYMFISTDRAPAALSALTTKEAQEFQVVN